jgi:hypothetical protein
MKSFFPFLVLFALSLLEAFARDGPVVFREKDGPVVFREKPPCIVIDSINISIDGKPAFRQKYHLVIDEWTGKRLYRWVAYEWNDSLYDVSKERCDSLVIDTVEFYILREWSDEQFYASFGKPDSTGGDSMKVFFRDTTVFTPTAFWESLSMLVTHVPQSPKTVESHSFFFDCRKNSGLCLQVEGFKVSEKTTIDELDAHFGQNGYMMKNEKTTAYMCEAFQGLYSIGFKFDEGKITQFSVSVMM